MSPITLRCLRGPLREVLCNIKQQALCFGHHELSRYTRRISLEISNHKGLQVSHPQHSPCARKLLTLPLPHLQLSLETVDHEDIDRDLLCARRYCK